MHEGRGLHVLSSYHFHISRRRSLELHHTSYSTLIVSDDHYLNKELNHANVLLLLQKSKHFKASDLLEC